jgi:hypothetical protein
MSQSMSILIILSTKTFNMVITRSNGTFLTTLGLALSKKEEYGVETLTVFHSGA